MKERPILFSAPMVRAILNGTKSQTRRVAKLTANGHVKEPGGHRRWHTADFDARLACPYGQPGDRLWVRETFAEEYDYCDHPEMPGAPTEHFHFGWHYRADGNPVESNFEGFLSHWKPSIHMPRRASRITLEITGVRLERLQDISEVDANAEGCERLHEDEHGYVFRDERDWKLCPKCGGTRLHDALGGGGGAIHDVDCIECDTYQKRFKHLWQSINGPDSWAANPLVWVVEFKQLEQPA